MRPCNRKCKYFSILCFIMIVMKVTIYHDNFSIWNVFSDRHIKRNNLLTLSEESVTPKYRLKHHEIQYSKDNKFETFDTNEGFIIPSNWENTLAITKLKQTILNNARNQILIKRQF